MVVDHPGEGGAKSGEVGTALLGVDAVGEGEDLLVVAVVVLQGHLHGGLLQGPGVVEGGAMGGFPPAVDVPHHAGDAGVEEVGAFDVALSGFLMPPADEVDLQSLVEVGDLLEVSHQGVEVVFHPGEDLWVRQEGYGGAVLAGASSLLQVPVGYALAVFLGPGVTVPLHLGLQFYGEGVDD